MPDSPIATMEQRLTALEAELKKLRPPSVPPPGSIAAAIAPSQPVIATPIGVPQPQFADGQYFAVKDAGGKDAIALYGGGGGGTTYRLHDSIVSVGGYGFSGAVQLYAEGQDATHTIFAPQPAIDLAVARRQISVSGTGNQSGTDPIIARLTAGGAGCAGVLLLFPDTASPADQEGKSGLALSSDGTIVFRTKDGAVPLSLGSGDGVSVASQSQATGVFVESSSGPSQERAMMTPGLIALSSETGNVVVRLAGGGQLAGEAQDATVQVGGHGKNGLVQVFPSSYGFSSSGVAGLDLSAVELSGSGAVNVGGAGNPGLVSIFGNDKTLHEARIVLDGAAGDIVLRNADCAEDFDLSPDCTDAEPGSVMVVDVAGTLRHCERPYDNSAIGVVSGAGPYKPALVLDRQDASELRGRKRITVALLGKVMCRVDARFGAICPGDLLTTSPTLGCAMRVTKKDVPCGALLGKALGSWGEGQGLVPMLVCKT